MRFGNPHILAPTEYNCAFCANCLNRRSSVKANGLALRAVPQWRRHLDEIFVKVDGETHSLRRAVDREGEVFEIFATKKRDRKAALRLPKHVMKR